jgi:hypothetical protein
MLINTILIQRTIERQELWAQLKPEDFRALTPPAGPKDTAERIRALSGIMRELGYQSGESGRFRGGSGAAVDAARDGNAGRFVITSPLTGASL